MKANSVRLALGICLILTALTGCTLDQIAAQQERATGLWDELVEGEIFGRSCVSTQVNLY
jgi:hypothetical protein